MLWLTAIILSYLCFALSSLGDKIVLAGPSKPKSYTFFVGLLSIFVIFLIPFVGFTTPSSAMTWWFIILEAFVYIGALYAMFYALDNYDVCKIMPTIGAAQPVFIALLSALFWGYQSLTSSQLLAFIILLTGSVLISIDKNPKITKKSLEMSLIAALLFSLDFIFSKFVFNDLSFWNGFIWMRMFSFLFVLVFFADKGFRSEIKGTDAGFDRKTGWIFIATQTFGGLANILQSFAISLVPIAYLAIMNAMKGIQYVFLFILVVLISLLMPKVLKEEISKRMMVQKIVAIVIIGIGLAILVL